MGIFGLLKKKKTTSKDTVENDIFMNFFEKIEVPSYGEDLLIDKYLKQLDEIKSRFQKYKDHSEEMIRRISDRIVRTVFTKGDIVNPTPFYNERLGSKLNGKVIDEPIISNYCMKYHYDHDDRILMVEEYSTFLKRFMITEMYLYHDSYAEKLRFSSGDLLKLFVFDHAFANTQLSLSFSNYRNTGYMVEEFVYENNRLIEIHSARKDGNYKEIFTYEKDKLVMIEMLWPNGSKTMKYTTKKPNFKKMRKDVYEQLKSIIDAQYGEFKVIGMEGFLDQRNPEIGVCFSKDENVSDLIADWNVQMKEIAVYDWQFSSEQERKCVKMVAEIIVDLVHEGRLSDKQIYFHQNQICVSQVYPDAKSVFKKANISVK